MGVRFKGTVFSEMFGGIKIQVDGCLKWKCFVWS